MKQILVFILALISFSPVLADTPLSEAEFTQLYITTVKKISPKTSANIKGPLEIEFTAEDKTKSTTFLENAYKAYRTSPDKLTEILKTYSQTLTQSLKESNSELKKEQVFPVIKNKKFIHDLIALVKKNGEDVFPYYYQQLNAELYVLYVVDLPSSIHYLHKSELKKLGLKEADLLALAKENLRGSIPQVQLKGDPSKVSMLIAGGMYEASFLLFDDIWTKKRFPVKGDIVVYLPTRDLVLITGSEDKAGLAKLYNFIHKPENNWSYTISNRGFVRSNGHWKVFKD